MNAPFSRRAVPLILSSFFLAIARLSLADTVWNNGTPDQESARASDFEIPNQIGDDFTRGTTATANQIQWWGVYGSGNTPTEPDDFTIRFFNIVAGVPDVVPFASYNVGDVGRVDSGLDLLTFFANDIYSYSATIPDTLLAPGDYLLSIVNNTAADTDDSWFWATSNNSSGMSWDRDNDGEAWIFDETHSLREYAFNIGGTVVPEPGTSALLFVGFSLVGLFLRKSGQNGTVENVSR
jgi:hypothetical protein